MVELWNAGKTAPEIAIILGHGLTGNAVIGCANRMRKKGVHVVTKPTGPAPDRSQMAPKSPTRPRPPTAPKRPEAEIAALKLKIRELRTEKNMPAGQIAEAVGLRKSQVGGLPICDGSWSVQKLLPILALVAAQHRTGNCPSWRWPRSYRWLSELWT